MVRREWQTPGRWLQPCGDVGWKHKAATSTQNKMAVGPDTGRAWWPEPPTTGHSGPRAQAVEHQPHGLSWDCKVGTQRAASCFPLGFWVWATGVSSSYPSSASSSWSETVQLWHTQRCTAQMPLWVRPDYLAMGRAGADHLSLLVISESASGSCLPWCHTFPVWLSLGAWAVAIKVQGDTDGQSSSPVTHPRDGWGFAGPASLTSSFAQSLFLLSQVLIPNKHSIFSIQSQHLFLESPAWDKLHDDGHQCLLQVACDYEEGGGRCVPEGASLFSLISPSCPPFLPHCGPADLQLLWAYNQSHSCLQPSTIQFLSQAPHTISLIVLLLSYQALHSVIRRKITPHKRQ